MVSVLRSVYNRIVKWHLWIERQEGWIALLVGSATLMLGLSELIYGWGKWDVIAEKDLMAMLTGKAFWFNMAHWVSGVYFVLFTLRFVLKRVDPISSVYGLVRRDRDAIYQECRRSGPWPHFEARSCTQDDVPVLADLGKEAFTESMIKLSDRVVLFREWLSANRDAFALITHGKQPVGYVCVLPVKVNTAHKHMQGKQSQFTFGKEDIDDERSKFIYVNAVYLRSEYRRTKAAVLTIIDAVLQRAAMFAPTQLRELTIYAEAFTPKGIDLLGGLGFHPSGAHSLDKKAIYVLEFRQPGKATAIARATIDLVKSRIAHLRSKPIV